MKFECLKSCFNKFFWFVYYCLGIALWFSFIFSLRHNLIYNESITHYIECQRGFDIYVPKFVNIESIKKVVETIGVTSILLAWLYAAFDKLEIGVKYIQLLRRKYRFFWLCTLSHISSVLLCIWSSYSGTLELSCISFLIVIWGCFIHWKALKIIIILPSKRRELAITHWKEEIEEASKDKANTTALLQCINNFIKSINPNDAQISQITDLIFMSMKYTYEKARTEKKNPMICISSIWQCLLDDCTKNERTTILRIIFRKLSDEIMEDEIKFNITGAYMLWVYKKDYKAINVDSEQKQSNITNVNLEIRDILRFLIMKNNNSFDVSLSLISFFWYMIWLEFLNSKNVVLSSEFFELELVFSAAIKKKTTSLFGQNYESFAEGLYPIYSDEIKRTSKNQVELMIESL